MSIPRVDVSEKKTIRKSIPKSRHSAAVPVREQEHGGAEAMSIRYSPPAPQEPESEEIESGSLFLKTLGRILHKICGKKVKQLFLTPDEIKEVYVRTLTNVAVKKRNFRISSTWYKAITEALERIPIALLAEKDPDHADDIPDISELLALEAYTRKYEQTDPGGETNVPLFNYHRGEPGQPDFVYRTGENEVVKRYDPLQLPRDNSREGREHWLADAYDKHAGGKGAGAVCILDVSMASKEQIEGWIHIFNDYLEQHQITEQLEQLVQSGKPEQSEQSEQSGQSGQQEQTEQLSMDLIKICNTYVVSYGSNAENAELKELQAIFDHVRDELERSGKFQLLKNWRKESAEPIDFGDLFGGF